MLTLQAVTKLKTELEGAFKPLHCIAQVYDTGQKLRFKVFDQNYDTACEMADLSLPALLDQDLLAMSFREPGTKYRGVAGLGSRVSCSFGWQDRAALIHHDRLNYG